MNTAMLLLLVLRAGGATAGQSGALVGTWSNVAYLQASQPPAQLTAKTERLNMEATDANHH